METGHPICLLGYSLEKDTAESSRLLVFRLPKAEMILVDTLGNILLFICITASHVQTLSKQG